MPALALLVPLIAAYLDQARPWHHPTPPPAIMRTMDLPPRTETIYFVAP